MNDDRFIAADIISKVIIVAVLAFWAKYSNKGSYCWSITSFSLCTRTNSLVVWVCHWLRPCTDKRLLLLWSSPPRYFRQ
uniref:Uncharacterized protein n=1 Tax=Brassica oleracea TaxID=3712 RepID=A0A3P6E335_BRAOL|nr:unnamed protein product [Brassica oleracea]